MPCALWPDRASRARGIYRAVNKKLLAIKARFGARLPRKGQMPTGTLGNRTRQRIEGHRPACTCMVARNLGWAPGCLKSRSDNQKCVDSVCDLRQSGPFGRRSPHVAQRYSDMMVDWSGGRCCPNSDQEIRLSCPRCGHQINLKFVDDLIGQ